MQTKEEYEKYVESGRFKNYNDSLALIGLLEQVGEVAGLMKKKAIYPQYFKDINSYNNQLKLELGDVLWQYVNLVKILGYSLEEIIELNEKKLNKRFNNANLISKGGER